MSCGEQPRGDFHDSRPVVTLVEREGKTTVRLGNRAAENVLIKVLASKLGINVAVETNRHSALPTVTGDKENVDKLLELLDA